MKRLLLFTTISLSLSFFDCKTSSPIKEATSSKKPQSYDEAKISNEPINTKQDITPLRHKVNKFEFCDIINTKFKAYNWNKIQSRPLGRAISVIRTCSTVFYYLQSGNAKARNKYLSFLPTHMADQRQRCCHPPELQCGQRPELLKICGR